MLKLVVGLGNPGHKYEQTRHNIGFMAIDELIRTFPTVYKSDKMGGQIFESDINGFKAILLKPQTFMNLSGESVAKVFQFYKIEPHNLIVIHDELDLDLGQIRFKQGGGTGGHNGIRSIDACLGKANLAYYKVRIGIGHPARNGVQMSVSDYVLTPFNPPDLSVIANQLQSSLELVGILLTGQEALIQKAQTKFQKSAKEKG